MRPKGSFETPEKGSPSGFGRETIKKELSNSGKTEGSEEQSKKLNEDRKAANKRLTSRLDSRLSEIRLLLKETKNSSNKSNKK